MREICSRKFLEIAWGISFQSPATGKQFFPIRLLSTRQFSFSLIREIRVTAWWLLSKFFTLSKARWLISWRSKNSIKNFFRRKQSHSRIKIILKGPDLNAKIVFFLTKLKVLTSRRSGVKYNIYILFPSKSVY